MLLPLRRPGPSATYFTICFTTRLTTGRWHSDAVGYVLYRMCWPTLLHALLLEDDTVTPSCSLFFLFNYVALFFLPALLHALLLEDDTVTPSCSLFSFQLCCSFLSTCFTTCFTTGGWHSDSLLLPCRHKSTPILNLHPTVSVLTLGARTFIAAQE